MKIAMFPHAPDELQDELLPFPSAGLSDRPLVDPRADEDMDDEEDEEEEGEDDDDDDWEEEEEEKEKEKEKEGEA